MEEKKTYFSTYRFDKNIFKNLLRVSIYAILAICISYVIEYCLHQGSGQIFRIILIPIISMLLCENLAIIEDRQYEDVLKDKKNRLLCLIFTVFMSVLVFYKVGFNESFANYFLYILAGALSVSAVIDFKIQELPDLINVLFLILTIIFYSLYMPHQIGDAFIRAIIMTVAYSVLSFIGGLGFGDVKLLFPISMAFSWLGYIDFWAITLAATFAYLIPVVAYNIVKKKPVKGMMFAFGPYIIIGFFLTFLNF